MCDGFKSGVLACKHSILFLISNKRSTLSQTVTVAHLAAGREID